MSTTPNAALQSNGSDFVKTIHNDTYPLIDPSKADLTGRNVFISGASRGIGKATAVAYARAGASAIVIAARSDLSAVEKEMTAAASSAKKPAPKIIEVTIDVTDPKSVEAAAAKIKGELGHLDIVLNNAGYLEEFKPLADSDPAEWWRTWEVNIKGPYLVLRSFLPLLLASPRADKTVINTSSIGAHIMMPGASSYQSTKLALLRLTEFSAFEYGSKGVLVYAIHPGGVMTDLAKAMPKESHGMLSDKPELAGDTVVWLTQERREWLQARYVSVNWDMAEFEKKRDEIVESDLLKVRMAVEFGQ